MKAFIQEYGLLIVAIIVAFMFFSLINFLIGSKDTGIVFVFNNHQLYTEWDEELGTELVGSLGSPLDAINGVQNTLETTKRPHFEVADGDYDTLKISDYLPVNSGSIVINMNDLKIDGGANKYNIRKISGYNEVLKVFTGIGAIKAVDSNGVTVDSNNIELVLVVYEPEMAYTLGTGVVKKTFVTEQVDALDKYGNRIWDPSTNSFVKTEQLKYKETPWHKHIDGICSDGSCGYMDITNFEINMRVPCKIKAIYRYQDGAIKCEYIKIFKNEVIDAYTGLIIDGKIEP